MVSLSSSRKWPALQVNSRSPGYDQVPNANRWRDYSHSTCEDGERCRLQHVQEYDNLSTVDSQLDLSRQQILPDDQDTKQRERILWPRKNQHNRFETIVWTDESMIQLESHQMYSYRKVGGALRPKARPKYPLKIMVWAGISRKGPTNICLLNCSINSSVY